MHLEYIPYCGTNISGKVYLAFDYDPADVTEVRTAQTLSSMQGTVSGSVFSPHTMVVDTNRIRKDFYTGDIPTGQQVSLNDYSPGIIIMLLSPSSAPSTVGELYINYTIQLKIPQTSDLVEEYIEESTFDNNIDNGGIPTSILFPPDIVPVDNRETVVATNSGTHSLLTFLKPLKALLTINTAYASVVDNVIDNPVVGGPVGSGTMSIVSSMK